MKSFIVCLISSLLSVSCIGQSYHTTKVGPNRYAVISRGHDYGPENYTHILETANKTCNAVGYEDYIVNQVAYEPRRVVVFITCNKE